MQKALLTLFLLGLSTACGGAAGGGDRGSLALIATDAPFAYEVLRSATVVIDRVTLDGGPGSALPAVSLPLPGVLEVELTELRNGEVLRLVQAELPPGAYTRLYLHFAAARMELVNAQHYDSADGSLSLPETGTLGVECALAQPLVVSAGSSARLLIDFDLMQSLVPQGEDPLLASAYALEPVLHLARPAHSGEIRGLVKQPVLEGSVSPVDRATLYFLPSGVLDSALAVATTASEADGSFAQLGLPPGTYDVRAVKGSTECLLEACCVEANATTLIELCLP